MNEPCPGAAVGAHGKATGSGIVPAAEHALRTGVVIIGRNEGPRLVACLASLASSSLPTVYVDSGSTDGSVATAEDAGAAAFRLDMSRPFTAARARNAGFRELMASQPGLDFVQFVDGDCVIDAHWISTAANFLDQRPDIALVFGRRREIHPNASIYNAMCDAEWDTQIGEAQECGGDILIRATAFKEAGGYSDTLIAGEEPDLCVRLREKGWVIWRLDAEMTRHDANITRFSQWWRRSMRAGHAFAEVSRRHGRSDFGIWKASLKRTVLWGTLPILALVASVLWHPACLLLLALLPLQVIRLGLKQRSGIKGRWARAFFAVLGKFAEFQGVMMFYASLFRKRDRTIIEYK